MKDSKEIESKIFNITEAKDTLDRTINFINSCDNKASIILGIYGIVISIILANGVTNFVCSIKTVLYSNIPLTTIIFICFKMLLLILFFLGIYKLISVLIARLKNKEKDSHIFFNDIARYTNFKQYKEKAIGLSEEEYLDDLIAQIYVNSRICSKKFHDYKTGLVCTIISLFGFLIVCILEIII